MLAPALAVVAIIAWSGTAAVAIADVFGERPRTGRVGRAGLVLSTMLTAAASIVLLSHEGGAGFFGRPDRYVFLATVIGIGSVVLARKLPMRATTALVAPFGAIVLAAYLLAPAHRPVDSGSTMLPLLMVHIGLVLIGIGTFALAAFASTLYLVQERQLRTREFGRLFHKLPSLEELDTASFRLVLWGFVVYTAALALGFAWTAQSDGNAVNPRVVLAVVAWAVFAAVIHTRITTGWRGRQSARMTIIGCVATYLVLAGYMIR